MSLRRRSYLKEMTTSGVVPHVVKPWRVMKKVSPSLLSGVIDVLSRYKRRKKRLVQRFSKQFSPPLPPRI